MQPAPIHHYENFPVASLLCPKALRAPIAAIYHFARTADDLADEGGATAEQRLQDLQCYRANLDRATTWAQSLAAALNLPAFDTRWEGVFAPLAHAICAHALPVHLLHDLLDAFVQDVELTRDGILYADDAALLDYCRRSANPVGRLMLNLYGVNDHTSLLQSDAICTALQLINFWQDRAEDMQRGRDYLPKGHSLDQELRFARELMMQGAPLARRVKGRAGWELRAVVQGGLRILDKLDTRDETEDHKQLARPTLKKPDFIRIAWHCIRM
jgi:squalene synthase HpnC